jgi:hypothetical protein
MLAHRDECLVCHPLHSLVQVTPNDHAGPQCLRVDGDLHPNLAARQVVLLKRPTAVLTNQPFVADVNKGVQQQSGEAWVVSPRGTQPTILFEGVVGIVAHLRTMETRKCQLSRRNQHRKEKTVIMD